MSNCIARLFWCFCLVAGSAWSPSSAEAQAPSATPLEVPDPNGWSVKVYPYPKEALIYGFAARDHGRQEAWTIPSEKATADEVGAYLRESHEMMTELWKKEGLTLPKGSLAAYDRQSQTLAVRTTGAMHERIAVMSRDAVSNLPHGISFSVHLLEADEKLLREIVQECSAKVDHRAALVRLEGLFSGEQVRDLGTLRLEARSGQRAKVSSGSDYEYVSGLAEDEKGQMSPRQEARRVGAILEMEPILSPDGLTVSVGLTLESHPAPPTQRWETVGQRGGRALELSIPDFHVARFTTVLTILSGTTKLIGVWRSNVAGGQPATDRLQAAFLKANAVPQHPSTSQRLGQLLVEHGANVMPIPQGALEAVSKLPPGMEVRRFRVPPDFFQAVVALKTPPTWELDPFAPTAPPIGHGPIVRYTGEQILKEGGIPFPEGASATFKFHRGELVVTNTPENLKLVESYLQGVLVPYPKVLVTTLHLIQGDAATIRRMEADTSSEADHEAVWEAVEAQIQAGSVKVLRTAWLETRSGQRATYEDATEHVYKTATRVPGDEWQPPIKEGEEGKQPRSREIDMPAASPDPLRPQFEMRPVGLRLELEALVGPDESMVDFTYTLASHFAPPTTRRNPVVADGNMLRLDVPGTDFHQVDLNSAIILTPGRMRLLGIWKPTGTPEFEGADVMQAAFLKVDLVTIEPGSQEEQK